MDQVSRPFQIALVLTVVLAAVWMLALRPKVEEVPPPAPKPPPAAPPRSAIPGTPGRALDRARSGAARADADAAARPERVDSAAGGPSAPGAPTPARLAGRAVSSELLRSDNAAVQAGVVAIGLFGAALDQAGVTTPAPGAAGGRAAGASPAAVERALAARRAVVLLFHGQGADDRGVRRELAKVGRRGGRVVVLSAPVTRVAAFGAITRGVRVLESPTVVVVGPGGQARALPGYTDSTEIDQAVQSVLAGR